MNDNNNNELRFHMPILCMECNNGFYTPKNKWVGEVFECCFCEQRYEVTSVKSRAQFEYINHSNQNEHEFILKLTNFLIFAPNEKIELKNSKRQLYITHVCLETNQYYSVDTKKNVYLYSPDENTLTICDKSVGQLRTLDQIVSKSHALIESYRTLNKINQKTFFGLDECIVIVDKFVRRLLERDNGKLLSNSNLNKTINSHIVI